MEMIGQLRETPGLMCRPSRVTTMLMSRACRNSIMIGDPLSREQMKQILSHLSNLHHPWCCHFSACNSCMLLFTLSRNCPHGRPTMRYTDIHHLSLPLSLRSSLRCSFLYNLKQLPECTYERSPRDIEQTQKRKEQHANGWLAGNRNK